MRFSPSVVESVMRRLICCAAAVFLSTHFMCEIFAQNATNAGKPVSDHFDGKRFYNLDVGSDKNFFDLLRWQTARLFRGSGKWSKYAEIPTGDVPLKTVEGERLRATYIGHATVLLQFGGLNILTDPVWSKRVSPVSFAGPKRVRPAAIRFEDLPPIHVVVISHNHYDHLDEPTLKRLAREHNPKFYVGLGNKKRLSGKNIGARQVFEMDWWQSVEVAEGVRLTSVPARHWSGRGLASRNKTLWCGYVFESQQAGKIFFAGDTGMGKHFAQIAERFGAMRLALLPIGAYLPRWFMRENHLSPADAVKAHRTLNAAMSIGIHFDTFPLADEAENQAVSDLQKALADEPSTLPFQVPVFGRAIEIPQSGL